MPEDVSPDEIIVAAPGRLDCQLDDEAVLLDLDSGIYYGLDPVGARIWSLIAEPRTFAGIVEVLLEEYDVDRERCERDLAALLRHLEREGLAEIRPPAARA